MPVNFAPGDVSVSSLTGFQANYHWMSTAHPNNARCGMIFMNAGSVDGGDGHAVGPKQRPALLLFE